MHPCRLTICGFFAFPAGFLVGGGGGGGGGGRGGAGRQGLKGVGTHGGGICKNKDHTTLRN